MHDLEVIVSAVKQLKEDLSFLRREDTAQRDILRKSFVGLETSYKTFTEGTNLALLKADESIQLLLSVVDDLTSKFADVSRRLRTLEENAFNVGDRFEKFFLKNPESVRVLGPSIQEDLRLGLQPIVFPRLTAEWIIKRLRGCLTMQDQGIYLIHDRLYIDFDSTSIADAVCYFVTPWQAVQTLRRAGLTTSPNESDYVNFGWSVMPPNGVCVKGFCV